MALNGHWTDFVSEWMLWTEGLPSPELWRRWTAISAVAAAAERRVWVQTGERLTTFLNMYIMLVGPPGVGKFIIENTRGVMEEVQEPGTSLKAFRIAPDSMSKASFMDELAKSKTTRVMRSGPPLTYQSLFLTSEEFSVLLPTYDMEFVAVMNSLWNNKAHHLETRRHGPTRALELINPQVNWLLGAQPALLGEIWPESAWASGLVRRIIMIYASDSPINDLFAKSEAPRDQKELIVRRLAQMSQIVGEMSWTDEAASALGQWHLDCRRGDVAVPGHARLQDYNRSRTQFIIKLAGISAISRGLDLTIQIEDLRRAFAWLFEAEDLMPDVFRAMVGKNDSVVMDELHAFMWTSCSRGKEGKSIHQSACFRFLAERVPSDKVLRIWQIAEMSGVVARVAGSQDEWVPRPRYLHGVKE